VDETGSHGWRLVRDRFGNITAMAAFGTNNLPVLAATNGFAFNKIAFDYDDRGNPTNTAFFGVTGPCAVAGCHRIVREYDQDNNTTLMACFDTNNLPIPYVFTGAFKCQAAYDARGNATNINYFGTNGLPVLTRGGFASTTARWNDRDEPVEQECFGTNGEPVACRDGYQRRVVTYDADGKTVSDQKFGPDGKLLPQPQTP
jgi:hypothetical protein